MEHLLLSARAWWCAKGEPISWAFLDPFRIPLFEVDGLDEHGKRKRGFLTRTAFQVGALPFRIGSWMTAGEDQADDRYRPTAVVSARSVDTTAVRLTGTRGETSPGNHPGILVATPSRLALLEQTEIPDESHDWFDKGLDKVKKATGPIYQLADDFAGTMSSTVNSQGRYFDHKGQTRTPRVAERASTTSDQIADCGIVQREFRRLGYDKDNRNHTYLRITFTDSSRLDLALPPKANPDRALNLVRNTSRSAGGSPPR